MLSFTLTLTTIIGLALASDSVLNFGIAISTIIGLGVCAIHCPRIINLVK